MVSKKKPVVNPFEKKTDTERSRADLTVADVDQALYGKIDYSNVGQKPVQKVSIAEIMPDPAQPRRTVPKSVVAEAKSSNVPVWQAWHRMAGRLTSKPIDLRLLLRGEGEGAEQDPLGIPLVDTFMELVGLAASIYRDGLINPISIFSVGPDRYQIETGEGRWISHTMLAAVLEEEKWSKIDALIVSKPDVWRQAAENGARRPLNAIGMARQLALLIMDLWRGRDGASFVPYGQMVQDGDVDRKFYAQVADGKIWHVKGHSERILQVTGLKSRAQLQQYRALLNVSDDLWARADENNWAEGRIREMIRPPQPTSTTVDVAPHKVNPVTDSARQKDDSDRKYVSYYGQEVEYTGMVEKPGGTALAAIYHLKPDGSRDMRREVRPGELRELPGGSVLPTAPSTVQVGQTYRNWQGKHYLVLAVNGGLARCKEVSPVHGGPLAGPFSINVSELMPLPKKTEDVPNFDNEKAMASILGDDRDPDRLPERQEEMLVALYRSQPVVKNAATRMALDEKLMIHIVDRDAWDMGITKRGVEYLKQYGLIDEGEPLGGWPETETQTDPQDDDTPEGKRLPVPPVAGLWVKYHEWGRARVYGSILRHEWDDQRQDYRVFLLTERGEKAYSSKTLFLAGDETPPSARSGQIPDGGWQIGMQVTAPGDYPGVITELFPDGHKVWVLVQGHYLQPHWSSALRLIEGSQVPEQTQSSETTNIPPRPEWAVEGTSVETMRGGRGVILDTYWNPSAQFWGAKIIINNVEQFHRLDELFPLTAPLDEAIAQAPQDADIPPLPEWAASGKRVIHNDTGKACVVDKPTWAAKHNTWVLRVHVDGHFDYGRVDAFRPDDGQFQAAPRERHPALHPANANGTICQEQLHLGQIEDGARRLKLLTDKNSPFLTSLRALTAEGLRTRLRNGGSEQTGAYLEAAFMTLREIEKAKHEQLMAAINQMEIEVAQVYQDIIAEAANGTPR